MYVRDLKPFTQHFEIRHGPRASQAVCRRCGRAWSTTRLNKRDPRLFWPADDPRRGRPHTSRDLERHWATPHSRPHPR